VSSIALDWGRNQGDPRHLEKIQGLTILIDADLVLNNMPKWHDFIPRHGITYGNCRGMHRWLEVVEEMRPRIAVTSWVGEEHVWRKMWTYIEKALLYVEEAILVPVADEKIIHLMPEDRDVYPLVVGRQRAYDDFIEPFKLVGRHIWIDTGEPLSQWRRYCEYTCAGAVVEGVILSRSVFYSAYKGKVYESNPYRLVYRRSLSRDERVYASLSVLVGFWSMR